MFAFAVSFEDYAGVLHTSVLSYINVTHVHVRKATSRLTYSL